MTAFYTKTFDVTPGSTVGSQRIEDQFLLVEQGFTAMEVDIDAQIAAEIATRAAADALLAPINNPTFTGTVTVPTPSGATDAATKGYVDGVSLSATLPGQFGNAGKFIQTDGTIASWAAASTPAATETLTNKTITSPTINTPVIAGTPSTTEGMTGFDTTAKVPSYYNGSSVVQVGYLNIPQNSQSTAYTAVITDAGKHLLHPSADTTARVFTIPANSSVAYPIGTALTFINQNGAGTVTIAINTDTMRLAGAGTTGSRTLAANGVATALKITSTEWIVSGTNLT